MVQGPDSHLHFGLLPLTSIRASVEMPQEPDSYLPGSEIDYCYPMGTTVNDGPGWPIPERGPFRT